MERLFPREAKLTFVVGLGVLASISVALLGQHGVNWFFRGGDPVFFRAVARSPFGTGAHFPISSIGERAYRYGRIGLPLAGWLLAFGHGAAATWPMLCINMVALAAIPALAVTLLDAYGLPAWPGVLVAVAPGLWLLTNLVYGDPLMVALVLLGYVFEARHRRRSAIVALALALLVKEVALLAIVPLLFTAVRRRDRRAVLDWSVACVPYGLWSCWVWLRIGQLPVLAHTTNRTAALSLPFVGMLRTPHGNGAPAWIGIALCTAIGVSVAAWAVRDLPIAGAAACAAVLAACAGPNTLLYEVETVRVLALAQVCGLLCGAALVLRRREAEREVAAAAAGRTHTGDDAGARGTVVQRDRALSG